MMNVMLIFLILGMLKLIFLALVISLVVYILVQRKLNKRNQRKMSVRVLKNLSKVKFSALINSGDPDEECSICFE